MSKNKRPTLFYKLCCFLRCFEFIIWAIGKFCDEVSNSASELYECLERSVMGYWLKNCYHLSHFITFRGLTLERFHQKSHKSSFSYFSVQEQIRRMTNAVNGFSLTQGQFMNREESSIR